MAFQAAAKSRGPRLSPLPCPSIHQTLNMTLHRDRLDENIWRTSHRSSISILLVRACQQVCVTPPDLLILPTLHPHIRTGVIPLSLVRPARGWFLSTRSTKTPLQRAAHRRQRRRYDSSTASRPVERDPQTYEAGHPTRLASSSLRRPPFTSRTRPSPDPAGNVA